MGRKKPPPDCRLERRKPQLASGLMLQDKRDDPTAEVADAVEQEHRTRGIHAFEG
jgi:hypothetical protein